MMALNHAPQCCTWPNTWNSWLVILKDMYEVIAFMIHFSFINIVTIHQIYLRTILEVNKCLVYVIISLCDIIWIFQLFMGFNQTIALTVWELQPFLYTVPYLQTLKILNIKRWFRWPTELGWRVYYSAIVLGLHTFQHHKGCQKERRNGLVLLFA